MAATYACVTLKSYSLGILGPSERVPGSLTPERR